MNSVTKTPVLANKCVSGGCLNAAAALYSLFYNGNGTQGNPFIITSGEHLQNTVSYTNMSNRYYKLGQNIDLSSYGSWTPVSMFNGVLDGNGKKITGLYIYSDNNYSVGLFDGNNGIIKNLDIQGEIYVYGNNSGYAGVIAGRNFGLIDNCEVLNGSYIYVSNENFYVGGIAGLNDVGIYTGTIKDCINNAYICGYANNGGIAGKSGVTIMTCINNGRIEYWGSGTHSQGGIAGVQFAGSITSSVNNGTIAYSSRFPGSSTVLQPNMAHIIGYKTGGTSNWNTWPNGYVDKGYLTTVFLPGGGVHDQALYVKNAEIGRY